MAEKKYVYHFKDAHGLGKELLGGKGAGLAEMTLYWRSYSRRLHNYN